MSPDSSEHGRSRKASHVAVRQSAWQKAGGVAGGGASGAGGEGRGGERGDGGSGGEGGMNGGAGGCGSDAAGLRRR